MLRSTERMVFWAGGCGRSGLHRYNLDFLYTFDVHNNTLKLPGVFYSCDTMRLCSSSVGHVECFVLGPAYLLTVWYEDQMPDCA